MDEAALVDLLVTEHLMGRLPVLVVSGYAEVDGVAADLPRLTKPFRKDELAASVAGLTSPDPRRADANR